MPAPRPRPVPAAAAAAPLAVILLLGLAGCGDDGVEDDPTVALPSTAAGGAPATPTATTAATPTAGGSGEPSPLATGAPSATCRQGWTEPARGSGLFRDAVQALQDSQGRAYEVASVRYFSGPTPGGGSGAHYYLEVDDPAFQARVLLVAGAGPGQAAVAPAGTGGWRPGEWTGFRGTADPAPQPGVPGVWRGPAFDPVLDAQPLLGPQTVGCLDGT